MSAKDCPERRAGKMSGERRPGERFQDQRESWADLGYGWVREERGELARVMGGLGESWGD